MPTVAQKLCHDIVKPVLNKSSPATGIFKSSTKNSGLFNTSQNAKSSRSVNIDNKLSNKFKTVTGGKTIAKSKTSIVKKLAEVAVNTQVTGPLKCDNNCVTLVRKRDLQTSCKCGQKKKNVKDSCKSIQTLNNINYSLNDKAITNCVDTVSCGTQIFEKGSGINRCRIIKPIVASNLSSANNCLRIHIQPAKYPKLTRESFIHQCDHHCSRLPTTRCPKHWALSHYPTRGPDF